MDLLWLANSPHTSNATNSYRKVYHLYVVTLCSVTYLGCACNSMLAHPIPTLYLPCVVLPYILPYICLVLCCLMYYLIFALCCVALYICLVLCLFVCVIRPSQLSCLGSRVPKLFLGGRENCLVHTVCACTQLSWNSRAIGYC